MGKSEKTSEGKSKEAKSKTEKTSVKEGASTERTSKDGKSTERTSKEDKKGEKKEANKKEDGEKKSEKGENKEGEGKKEESKKEEDKKESKKEEGKKEAKSKKESKPAGESNETKEKSKDAKPVEKEKEKQPTEKLPEKKIKQAHEIFLKKHMGFNDGDDIEYEADELIQILTDITPIISSEPSLLEVPAPCVIVGDIHGQYDDLQRMFIITGDGNRSGATMRRYVFLGDYVDRGPNSLECICCLFAYKLVFPKMFNLLRGNHESAFINRNYGFYQELVDRYEENMGNTLWCLFNDVFDLLPLAALVHKRILCMHGGLSPHLNSLDDIRNLKRPIKTMEDSPLACDLLWSDPVIDLTGFVKNIVRGVSVCFGEDTVLKTCQKLNLDMVVRAHQMMINGFSFFCKRKLVTVFTAPRYDPEKNNKGAVMLIDKNLKAGFRLLAPATAESKGPFAFVDSYSRSSSESCYTSKEILSDEEKIKTYDPTEVYDASKMKNKARTEIKLPVRKKKKGSKSKSISLRAMSGTGNPAAKQTAKPAEKPPAKTPAK